MLVLTEMSQENILKVYEQKIIAGQASRSDLRKRLQQVGPLCALSGSLVSSSGCVTGV